MEWVDRINKVIDYLEENLGEPISEKAIEKIAACPYALLQGAFSQITGISLSEYVRRRKLTRAAYDILNSGEKLIDIGLKYGYQSPDAFRVAFKCLHGIAPVEVRKNNVSLTYYCRLRFTVNIIGVEKMDYTVIERAPFKVVGIRRTTPYGGGTWAIVKSDGSGDKLSKLTGIFFDLGICFGFKADGSNDYMCAVEWGEDLPGYESYTYPAATWLKFAARGKISEQVLGGVWNRINKEFLPQSKYQKADATIEKYTIWDEAADFCEVEIWIPVKCK
jgi:AraC family transcriptional regulator